MIPDSVRAAHRQQEKLGYLLEEEVKNLFSQRPSAWFFTSRRKQLDSFSQKIESGKVANPEALEDFVGAMLVVPMLSDLGEAVRFIEQFVEIQYRRPESDKSTGKKSSDFAFDDLRLYGSLRPPADLPPRPIDSIVFEIQVKTFLQHAWSIATHDLVYKYDRVSWARNRVAYQLKAVLEHADLSVVAIEKLEFAGHLPSVGAPERNQQDIVDFVISEWDQEFLPDDRRRLSMNLERVCERLAINGLDDLKLIVAEGKLKMGGVHPYGLTPYQCVMEYLSVVRPEHLKEFLMTGLGKADFYVFVTKDILDRLGLRLEDAPFARL